MGMQKFSRTCRVRRAVRDFLRDRRAVSAIIFALSAIPTVLAVGGAVDFTRYYDARKAVQSALDASVLAGATADNSSTVATSTFASWNVGAGFDGSVGSPQFVTGEDGNASTFAGSVSAGLDMYFTPLAGVRHLSFTVTAKAARTLSQGPGNVCLLVVNPTADKSLTINGNGVINAPGCTSYVFSKSATSATIDGSVFMQKLCFAGDIRINTTPDNVYTGGKCPVVTDPYAGKLPAAQIGTCKYAGPFNPGTRTLQPGTYCGGVNFNGKQNVTFAPGLYVLKGGPMLFSPGTYVGTGVTFYLADAASYLQLNADSVTQFTAPTTGTYEGILIYESQSLFSLLGLSTDLTVNGTKNWSGLIYLPSRRLYINGSSVMTATSRMIVVNQLVVNNDMSLSGGAELGSENTYSTARLAE